MWKSDRELVESEKECMNNCSVRYCVGESGMNLYAVDLTEVRKMSTACMYPLEMNPVVAPLEVDATSCAYVELKINE